MLLAPVRSLIERAHVSANPELRDYRRLWLADMEHGESLRTVPHQCEFHHGSVVVMSGLEMRGVGFWMSEYSPTAVQPCYVGACGLCRCAYFAAAYDSRDTLEAFVGRLAKARKHGRRR